MEREACEKLFVFYVAAGFLKDKAKPKQTGFATGSSGAPHVVCASDQIRATWVDADNNIIEIEFAKSSV